MSGEPPCARQPPLTPRADDRDAPRQEEEKRVVPAGQAKSGDDSGRSRDPGKSSRTAAAPKGEPEAFALRGRPVPAIRFRQDIIVVGTSAAALGLLASAWAAFEPGSFWTASENPPELRKNIRLPDAVANAPRGYDAVPVLGPPLPGDLGRPILRHQRGADAAKIPAARAIDDAAEAKRARVAAAALAARQSGVLMPLGEKNKGDHSSASRGIATRSGAGVGPSASAPFTGISRDANPHRIVSAPSPWTISGGSVLSASLLTGINSEVPGLVIAQLTQNAYDSITGRTLLIPQGSRLIGTYDSDIGLGKRRVHVLWQRIVWPNGASLRLDDWPASDAEGHSGLADEVDTHAGRLARGVALSTLLGAGAELGFGDEQSELVRALREASQQSGARAGGRLVDKALEIEPTIIVRPGWPVRILVREDLVLQPWRP